MPHAKPTSTFLSAAQVRQQFIDFFTQRAGHTFVPSSPVVPHNDPSLLFTNAGMNQFKPLFLGQVDPASPLASLKRAVNTQKCIRAGGKHNDLDDVGKDTYHHTFFEMLGNWSFGDYFKPEAIQWAWELLTDLWRVDPSRLYATYFEGDKSYALDPDRDAYNLWQRYLPVQRILPGNMKDNFWEMGDTGPCGPCSEIHYDGRPDNQRATVPGATLVNSGSPDVIEIWNLVFIQFNRTEKGLNPLPARHVDTGMGFERIVRVLQGKDSNYDTDVFLPLFAEIKRICKARDYRGALTDPIDTAYRVIADHARTLTFAICDGAEPGSDGRNYVLRRILRRAVRYGRQNLAAGGAFLCELVPTIVGTMGDAFPELTKNPRRIIDIIRDEEDAFGRTLDQGIRLFTSAADRAADTGSKAVAADDAFKLHDTYGFPIDLTSLMAQERGMTVDVAGFESLMEQARRQSRSGGKAGEDIGPVLTTDAVAILKRLNTKPTSDLEKYHARPTRARIVAIWNGRDVDENLHAANTRPTDRFALIFDRTNFYAEMGGQTADTGRAIVSRERKASVRDSHEGGEFLIEEVRATAGFVAHIGRIKKGELRVGDECELRLDAPRRHAIAANHTATHLLNLALRSVLGEHVDQKGSLVAPDRLRFDFSHAGPMTHTELEQIERQVQAALRADLPVFAEVVPIAQARAITGLRAVFGETYPDPVRLVTIGVSPAELLGDPANTRWNSYSIEFCGGTHLAHTGEAGEFVLIAEEGVAKGVRRITAVTGAEAAAARKRAGELASRITGAGELDPRYLPAEIAALTPEIESAAIPLVARAKLREQFAPIQGRVREIHKQAAGAGRERAVSAAREIAERDHGLVIVYEIPADADRAALLSALDAVRARHADAAILLISASESEPKVTIVSSVPQPLIARGLKAGDWVREASSAVGGKGGGRPDAAQGGGTQPQRTAHAVRTAQVYASEKLGIQ